MASIKNSGSDQGTARTGRSHLRVTRAPTAEKFTAHPTRGDKDNELLRPDRAAHAALLRKEYEAVWNEAAQRASLAGQPPPDRVVVDIRTASNGNLALESLESPSRGMSLLAVREVEGATCATVAIARKSSDPLLTRIEEYATGNTPKGAPKNNTLIAPIEHIRFGELASRWTDTAPMPRDWSQHLALEAWVEHGEGNPAETARQFREAAEAIGVEVSGTFLAFRDRIVIGLRCSMKMLAASSEVLSSLAELRSAKAVRVGERDLSSMNQLERRQLLDGFVSRLVVPDEDVPYVCLLDTGVNRGHPLLAPLLRPADMHTAEPGWGKQDVDDHGTGMAGLALHGDLAEHLGATGPLAVTHRLESSKVYQHSQRGLADLHGKRMSDGIRAPESAAPERLRVFSLAIATTDGRDRGLPSSWSSEVDRQCAGGDERRRRLMVVCAGNSWPTSGSDYPAVNYTDGILDPGQAWNALTVGACTHKTTITEPQYQTLSPLASEGSLCPRSTTSLEWNRSWPIKPEIVFEGGNLGVNAQGALHEPWSLRMVSTHKQHLVEPFTPFGNTSGATALAARAAAQVLARYPRLWPETVRALLVHSARWTPSMERDFPGTRSGELVRRMRVYGYGVPDMERAFTSAKDRLTLIIESSLTPFEKDATKEMHLHSLPWPTAELQRLGATEVRLRVTLSYFVHPNPARRGFSGKHPYPSHQLSFELQDPTESVYEFQRRLNHEHDKNGHNTRESRGWALGRSARRSGSIHSDWWTGKAADLAMRSHLAVFPTAGWWRKHTPQDGESREARYALIVSIETPPNVADIYTPIANLTTVVAPVAVSTVITT